MLMIIDNYDSFTYNLVQCFGILGQEVQVALNDRVSPEQVAASNPDRLVISPGPSDPSQAGASVDVIREFAGRKPILGVCLGHQALGYAFGADIVRANRVAHGKVSQIRHEGVGLFAGIPRPFAATRYHSLVIDTATLPKRFRPTAWAVDDGELMAICDEESRLFGLQFHPESIMTRHGMDILRNFLAA